MSIRFLLDESIPYALIEALGERDFAVEHLKRIGWQGIKNGEVYEIAQKERPRSILELSRMMLSLALTRYK